MGIVFLWVGFRQKQLKLQQAKVLHGRSWGGKVIAVGGWRKCGACYIVLEETSVFLCVVEADRGPLNVH